MNKVEPKTLSGFMELMPEDQILFDSIKNKIEEEFKNITEVTVFELGNIIASHTGPGTVALFYMGDERE